MVLLFLAESPMDMLLNLVGLTFVFDLDDQVTCPIATGEGRAERYWDKETSRSRSIGDVV